MFGARGQQPHGLRDEFVEMLELDNAGSSALPLARIIMKKCFSRTLKDIRDSGPLYKGANANRIVWFQPPLALNSL